MLQYLIDLPAWGAPPFLPSNLFLLGALLVAGFALLLYKGEYLRLFADGNKQSIHESRRGSDLAAVDRSSLTIKDIATLLNTSDISVYETSPCNDITQLN